MKAPPGGLRIATFDIDATPPIGSLMAYDPVVKTGDLGLRARGIVLLGAGQPIVLCAVDWIGIANDSQTAFRRALARAAGTSPDRVAVHALHQHDAPLCDFSAERILRDAGLPPGRYDGGFQRQVITNLATAVRQALATAQPVTQLGLGKARVEKVASNRRILGPDGKVIGVRYTACADPKLRAAPEGTIDPEVSLVSFWNQNRPVAILSYYATHPQSYYRTGIPTPDFPGIARFLRQLAVPSALHVHFTGAGGNIGAGKYNDGAMTNRLVLAQRLADGLRRAWENTQCRPITADEVSWTVESVALPLSKHLSREPLEQRLQNKDPRFFEQWEASRLAWVRACQAGKKIDLTCLKLGRARILHMPGELFVEYQLAAKALRPDRFVAMAAYGDYGPWYIGTAIAYEQGGYETEPRSSNVAPEVEEVLMGGLRKLLQDQESEPRTNRANSTGTTRVVRARQPNIVFIEVDDLTYSYAGAFGSRTAITPNIDRLAREGFIFDQSMGQGMMCGPSRNCLISGRYPHQLGFYRNGQMKSLAKGAWTLPAALQRAGYSTAWIGKSHLRPYRSPDGREDDFNAALGFDDSLHTLGRAMLRGKAGARPNPYIEHLKKRGLLETFLQDVQLKRNSTLPEDDYLDGWFARRTVEFIHDYPGGKPLFLWVNFSLPHGPYDVPDAYHAPFTDKPMPGESRPVNYTHPPSLIKDTRPSRGEARTIESQRGFHAAIHFVDRQVGRILEALEVRGMLEDTWIVFFSDHGIMEGAHGLFHKGTLFRQVTHPSLIIRGPAGSLRGRRVSQPVELTDLLPTFLELAGSKEKAPAGISLQPIFQGKKSDRRYAFGEIEGWIAVSDGHYRLIRTVEGKPALLFDELKDPENLVNLSETRPEIVNPLSAAVDVWLRQTGKPRPPRSR